VSSEGASEAAEGAQRGVETAQEDEGAQRGDGSPEEAAGSPNVGAGSPEEAAGSLNAGERSPEEAARSSDMVGDVLDDLRYRKRNFDEGAYTGYLKIAEGCNNACSFCAIPSIRGHYRSKRIEDCVREAQDMADAGIRELILIAQDTSQYGRDLYGKLCLPELLKKSLHIVKESVKAWLQEVFAMRLILHSPQTIWKA
jgi:tRNA A37 methylthiotransferase MiaB